MEDKGKEPEKKPVESRARRDLLLSLEEQARSEWEAAKVFERNAPETFEKDVEKRKKFFVTFPYPYMNGRLHIGHVFTLTKAEFAVSYQRMQGKNAIFPFAFHVTGMPIKACADKLSREISLYGNPPVFPEIDEQVPVKKETETAAKMDPTKFSGKKTKAVQKAGTGTQWAIMKSIGVPENEIHEFSDSLKWLKYFPPLAQQDLARFGLKADWRRSFITTEVNPFYDSFIRWQFETLRDQGRIMFGKRNTIYSPIDGQACADHDRASGEGVQPQEYTLVKLVCLEPMNPALAAIVNDPATGKGRKCSYLCATLRPETMYGLTNCWVLPDGEYGVYEINGDELVVCAPRAAMNMSYQDFAKERGKPDCVGMIKGQELIGQPTTAPNCVGTWDRIYTLPLFTISMEKGTGVVSSVVSDAPDDYAALRDLQSKAGFREKYGVKEEWCVPFTPIPIINIPGYGDTAAIKVVEDLKIKSQKDVELLKKAKEEVYLKGFYEGRLIVGPYKGEKVLDAKTKIRDEMVARGDAIIYAEPENRVVARSGCECVVALIDQWFLKYGEEEWQTTVREHLEQMNSYGSETKRLMLAALAWLHEWACSRSFGLGTHLPWDPQFVIESLSDSTIYMAYYTVAHFLQSKLDGSQPGLFNIKPEQMTAKIWDAIFLGKEYPKGETEIPEEQIKVMRNEFEYWYPLDLRVSGKDLIQNHLIFWLYNHIAIFDKDKWPRGVRCNGHLTINAEKMSKQTGNFLTVSDALRFGLADAGDGIEDANFVEDTANMGILRLTAQLDWIKSMLAEKNLRDGDFTFVDKLFDNAINKAITVTTDHFERMLYREAMISGFFDFQAARDVYRVQVDKQGMHRGLIVRFIEVQIKMLTPICPHYCEHVWKLLREYRAQNGLPEDPCTFIIDAPWPVAPPMDPGLERAGNFLRDTLNDARKKLISAMTPPKPKKGKGKQAAPAGPPPTPNTCHIYVAKSYPEYQEKVLKLLQARWNAEKGEVDAKDLVPAVKEDPMLKKEMKNIMKFVSFMKDAAKQAGLEALDLGVPFDQAKVLSECHDYILSTLTKTLRDADPNSTQSLTVIVVDAGNEDVPNMHKAMRERATPGKECWFREYRIVEDDRAQGYCCKN